MRKQIVGSIALIFFAIAIHAQKLPEPKLEPTPSTPAQDELINQGVALHDRRDFDGAIRRYELVLEENPNNVLALYEMAFSYFEKKDYRKSLEIAYRAAQFKSELLPRVYIQIGNAQDEVGEPKKAIETYKAGLKLFASDFLVHYNLAVTYNRLGDFEEARKAVKKSAGFNPQHPSSQILLALLFDRGGYKTPALLAACRFLVLEPNTQRSLTALDLLSRKMSAGVGEGKDSTTINIFMDPAPKKDEGDFGAIDLAMSLTKALEKSEKNKNMTAMQLLVGSFETLFGILGEQKADVAKFSWKYYAPYFAEMKKKGHVEAFVYYINLRSGSPEVSDWLSQNRQKVMAFLAWSKAYQWPKMD